MNSQELFTVGYEGRSIDEFVVYLNAHGIRRLIDIREIPISRKRGFSKSSLKARLEDEKIEYLHIRSLGSPSAIRNKLKDDHDFEKFFYSYSVHLSMQTAVLREVIRLAQDGLNCLLCFEREAENCHRSAVAKRMTEISDRPFHIQHI